MTSSDIRLRAPICYMPLFKLFGIRIWVTNAAVLALGAAYCWLCFSLSSKIMEHRSALLATALFMVAVYGKALNGTNHWFAVLAVMVTVNIGMEKMTPGRIAAAGALLGVASFFNQAHGMAALLAFFFFLVWRHSRAKRGLADLLRDLAPLLLGYTSVLLLLAPPSSSQLD
ncbi:MAG: hypothetical protein JWQ42_2831 [Edaphobacter sp.]|nr:hypothetical protein [Edaphobacter sp.]